MAARKVLTRAETQARTREELIEAAEQLFIANGYYATSMAAVAAEAGRTVGAVYSNFENKEDLCLEVLKRRSSGELSSLVAGFAAASDGDTDARVDALATWWARVSANSDFVILIAEYALSILRDPDRRAESLETGERFLESAYVLLGEYLPEGVSTSGAATREAVRAILSMGTGLAVGQAGGVIGVDESVTLLTTTFRLWMDRLVASVR